MFWRRKDTFLYKDIKEKVRALALTVCMNIPKYGNGLPLFSVLLVLLPSIITQ